MNTKNYFIIGGTGGIGKAMVEQLVQTAANEHANTLTNNDMHTDTDIRVFATYHKSVPDFEAENLYWIAMDICDEQSIKQAADAIKQQTTHIDWVI
ncbi:SDR family NAD(P)-dependent oxidoreductase, partial [Psychrobacter sp. 16-Bac2893]